MSESQTQLEPTATGIDHRASQVDKSDARVRRMFGEIAGRYDFLNHLLSLNIDRYWRRRAVGIASPRDNRPILDVCSGTGDLALAYDRAARKHGLDCPVVAADFCPEMLAIGREKAARTKVGKRITFVEADTQQLPFADNEFQIVSVAFGLRNVANTDRGLAEMARVCGPGGQVVVLEFSMPTRQPMKATYGWYFRRVLPRVGRLLMRNKSSAYSYLPESVGQFLQGEELADRMRAAGLEGVRFYPLTGGIATLYVGNPHSYAPRGNALSRRSASSDQITF